MITDYKTLMEIPRTLYDIGYGQVAILSLQINGVFKKGKFLREMKNELKDYEIKNYLGNEETANIILISKEKDLTEKGIGKKVSKMALSRIRRVIRKHKELRLDNVLFESCPNKIKRNYILR